MTNTLATDLRIGRRVVRSGEFRRGATGASGEAVDSLLASLLADFVSWVGCAWAVALIRREGGLETVHACGALSNVTACRNFIGSALERMGGESGGAILRLAHGSLHSWIPEYVTTVTIHEQKFVLAFGAKKGGIEYSDDDRQLILDAAAQLTLLLRRRRLASAIAADLVALEEIRRDLERARDVQSRLFPLRMPAMAGLDYFGESRPAAEVGGDFFDFIPLDGGRMAMSVGDISGHGVSAAILMSGVQAYVRGLTGDGSVRPASVVHGLNRTTYDISPENFFATLFYAQVDPSCGMLEYVNAGHEPALLVRQQGGVERLEATGTVLGLCPETHYVQRKVAVRPGDLLVAFTDGITEAAGRDGQMLRESGVLDVVRRHAGDRASDVVWRVVDAVEQYSACREDDRTVVVVKFTDSLEKWPACATTQHAFAA